MQKTNKWRILSIITLAIYTMLIVASVILIARNIIITLTFGLTLIILACCIWLIFTHTGTKKGGHRYILLAILVAIIATGEFIYFLTDEKNRHIIFLIATLTFVYLSIFRLLRQRYWSSLRLLGESSGNTANFKKAYLIINPKSGDGRAIKANIDKLAEQKGINVIMTEKGKDISESATEAVMAGADVLGISGGDGSIGAVAKVAISKGLPIVVLPGGTRCHFARDLGLEPENIVDSLAGFNGVERFIDVGEINGRIFLNNASFGLYADIVDKPDYRDNKLQVSRDVIQSIANGDKDPYDLQLQHRDISIKKAIQILVGVNKYNTVNLLELGHRKKLDEGILQVTAITKLNQKLAKSVLSVISIKRLAKNRSGSGLYQWTSELVTINSKHKKIPVGVDGESESYKTPVKIRIMPKSLRIYVPAEGIKNRRKSPLSIPAIRKIWQNIWHDTI